MTEIKERPILFSSEMVRAILDGRKTETRRVMKPQPSKFVMWLKWVVSKSVPRGYIQGQGYFHALKKDSTWLFKFPYGDVGDVLYVREGFLLFDSGKVLYRADKNESFYADLLKYMWKPSIFMPKKFSRIKLKIKEIRVEQVQEINNISVLREGLTFKDTRKEDVIGGFIKLWDSLNKKRGFGWDVNPWVWCISFERM